jgi:hypothetical protein
MHQRFLPRPDRPGWRADLQAIYQYSTAATEEQRQGDRGANEHAGLVEGARGHQHPGWANATLPFALSPAGDTPSSATLPV